MYSLIFDSPGNFPINKRPELFPGQKERSYIDNQLEILDIQNNEFIVIAPSSLWETKKYPVSKFKELSKIILEYCSNNNAELSQLVLDAIQFEVKKLL